MKKFPITFLNWKLNAMSYLTSDGFSLKSTIIYITTSCINLFHKKKQSTALCCFKMMLPASLCVCVRACVCLCVIERERENLSSTPCMKMDGPHQVCLVTEDGTKKKGKICNMCRKHIWFQGSGLTLTYSIRGPAWRMTTDVNAWMYETAGIWPKSSSTDKLLILNLKINK